LTIGHGFETIGAMLFQILGDISEAETFAIGSGIREIARLRKSYGRGRWRKRKGIARVQLVPYISLRYTGTKQLESDVRNSR
jgi:hypothetical protein